MNNLHLFRELENILRTDSTYCMDDGMLIKNKIVEDALGLNPVLLKHLLAHEGLKRIFFCQVEDMLVFDKVKFQRFVMNKSFLADSYTTYKNKIGLTDENDHFLSNSREIVLSWPYKDCVLEGGQTKEEAKRDEIFWSETLAPDAINRLTEPKVLTGAKQYDKDGEHAVEHLEKAYNLLIKGNNLLTLYSLREKFAGEIKLIYIDPPYNTGNDSFGYNDKFNHSSWLTFMKNRLEIARDLLKDGGSIFIECDKNEAAYLKVLCDMVFGMENFVSDIAVQTSYANGLKVSQKEKTILKMKDTLLVYKKGEIKIKPQYIEKHYWDTHYNLVSSRDEDGNIMLSPLKDELVGLGIIDERETITRQTINNPAFYQYVCENKDRICCLNPIHSSGEAKKLAQQSFGQVVEHETAKGNIQYYFNGRQIGFFNQCFHEVNGEEKLSILLGDIWTDIDFGNTQNEGGVDFPAGKKAEMLIYRIINMMTEENDLVLDFFSGSGTTAAVAHKMNRRWIASEQMELQIALSKKRLQNVIRGDQSGISKIVNWRGGGAFVYCELAKANEVFAEKIEAATTADELKTLWNGMKATDHLNYKIDMATIDAHAADFESLSIEDQKRFLIECLDKNLLYVPLGDIDSEEYAVSDADKHFTREFYKRA